MGPRQRHDDGRRRSELQVGQGLKRDVGQEIVLKQTMSKELIYEVESVTLSYIKKDPREHRVDAQGKTRSAGWSSPQLSAVVYVQAPLDGIYDLNFMAEPPSAVSAQVLMPISVHDVLGKMPKGFRGVRVHATSNNKEAIWKGPTRASKRVVVHDTNNDANPKNVRLKHTELHSG